MDKMINGILMAMIVVLMVGTGYNYYRQDQINERVLLDHAKHEEYSKRLDALEGKRPVGKVGSIGALP